MTSKMIPADRREQILAEALKQAEKVGIHNIKRSQIAARLDISEALINRYFLTMDKLRGQVMTAAVKRECLPVVAQGLALKDRRVMRAPEALRQRAAAHLGA